VAKRVTVMLIDGLAGKGPADETVSFSLDGISYEIDLSAKNAGTLKNWIGAARRNSGRRRGGVAKTPRARDDWTYL
jgi:Lsr2